MNKIKKKCYEINLNLQESTLQFQNFGNASIKFNDEYFIIKPSGVFIKNIDYKDFPLVCIKNGKYKGKLKPSSDALTHLEIYKRFKNLKSIVHTHSEYAVIWSQACMDIPVLGTTHSDYWLNKILVTDRLKNNEIKKNYQINIAKSIIKKINNSDNIKNCPGVLVANHGPFTWGENFDDAFYNAERIEYIAKLAFKTLVLNKKVQLNKSLIKTHFFRKNGPNSYYGQ